jgi:ParB family chromosome partitioning protein
MGKTSFDVKRSNIFMFNPEDLVIIGWDTEDGPEHPLWDRRAKRPVDFKLVNNIKFVGKILEPIGVRKNGNKAEVVFGKQRVKAAREINKEYKAKGCELIYVPAVIERIDDNRAFGMVISENAIRQGDSAIERALNIQRYLDLGHNEKEAADIFGFSLQSIRQQLSLLDLDKSVQKLVERGQLSATAATTLTSLSREEQKTEAEKLVASGTTTIADTTHAVRRTRAQKEGKDASGIQKAPGKKLLKKLLEREKQWPDEDKLNPSFIRGVKFALGDLPPEEEPGLPDLIAELKA